jgi:assimilatory nitrate reductase catalytic subunit
VWEAHRATTVGRDLDIGGLDWTRLEQPQQWPFAAGAEQGAARLYADGRFPTPDGRACFAAPAWKDVAQPRDARYPVALTTGRLRDQWHGMSRTGLVGRLFDHVAAPALQMHPQELDRRGWRAGDLLRVRSRHGELVLPVMPCDSVRPAQASVPMHWGEEFLGGRASDGRAFTGVNALANPARCPTSKQPELKHVAVRLEPANLPWRLTAAAWLPEELALQARVSLAALFAQFGHATATLFGREGAVVGVLLRAAAAEAVDAAVLARVEAALGLAGDDVLRYHDPRRGQRRIVRRQGEAVTGLLLAGDDAAAAWALPMLQDASPAASALARAILSGRATPPTAAPPRAAQVCNCLDVREDAIVGVLQGCRGSDGARLASVQQTLRCGTACGSCLPALKGLVQQVRPHDDAEDLAA